MPKPTLNTIDQVIATLRWIYRGQTFGADGPNCEEAARRIHNAYEFGPQLRDELLVRAIERLLFEELEQVFTGDGLEQFVIKGEGLRFNEGDALCFNAGDPA